jgi:hypothetical protein
MRWLGVLNSDVHPVFKPIFAPARFHPDAAQAKVVADTALRMSVDISNSSMSGCEAETG